MALSAFVDTNVLIRHLIGDPPDAAKRATAYLRKVDELLMPDVIVGECVFVLESIYAAPRRLIAELMRAAIGLPSIVVFNPDLVLRTLEVYESARLDFEDAYLVASAELSRVEEIVSFDKELARRSPVPVVSP